MNRFLILAFCLICTQVIGQNYTNTFKNLQSKSGEIDTNKHVLDQSIPGDAWKADAKIIINEISEEEVSNVTVYVKGTNDLVERSSDAWSGKTLIYTLDKYIDEKKYGFDIKINNEIKVTVIFDTQKVKIQANQQQTENQNDEDDSQFESYVGALASANFVGNNKFLKNLTPIVNLGSIVQLVNPEKNWFSMQLDVNPYVGGDIDTKDSVSLIPALMLPGKAGFVINSYLNFKINKMTITLMPFGFGLKFLPNLKDSSFTVIQHNIRGGLSLKYSNDFVLSAVLTQGWHNLTSESKDKYTSIFSNHATDINYITVSAQLALRGKSSEITNYIYFEWRGLLSRRSYAPFTNNAILTIGLRKTLELGAISNAMRSASSRGIGAKKSQSKKVHMLL